jgi:hypothetical protein
MNYKVMQRPMFKMGGKIASQGTGITSGLDEKVNMSDGRANYRDGPDLSGMSIEDLINLRQQNYNKSMSRLGDMRDIVRLQALGNLATNVLPNIEGRGLRGVVDFFKDPMTTQTAIGGLTGLKQVDLKEKELQGRGLDRLISGKIDLEKLEIARLKGTTTKTKMNYDATKTALDKTNLSEAQKQDILLGVISGGSYQTVQRRSSDLRDSLNRQIENGDITRNQAEEIIKNFEATALGIFQDKQNEQIKETDAEGGRVGRMMGSPMTGEQPMMNSMAVEKKDVAMETEGQGNDAYAMLRARLPQEIPDDVVRLIAYNKEAFADFASIKNQEDVTSFNQKYNVSMNIDVSTV